MQHKIPWSAFFDVESINRFVPVVELEDFLAKHPQRALGNLYYLQGYKEGWSNGEFVEKWDFRDCIEPPRYMKEDGVWRGYFWGYSDQVEAKEFNCVSVQGMASILDDLVENCKGDLIMLDRAENLLHNEFGSVDYWMARRSMRFSDALISVANNFRSKNLDSDDEKDDTVKTAKWEDQMPQRSGDRGGPFACVHLRRKDFVRSRGDHIPSLKGAADQLQRKMNAHNLKVLFVATDAPSREFGELKSNFDEGFKITRFTPSLKQKESFKDGGIAVIDQIICSHAKYFVGSYESTFSFRIQEEREMMGFLPRMTFDMMCSDGKYDCEKGSQWKIKYPKSKDEL